MSLLNNTSFSFDLICLVEKLKSFMVTKCFYQGFTLLRLLPMNDKLNNSNSALMMGGRGRSNSVEEITL